MTSSTPFLVLMIICSKSLLKSVSGTSEFISILNRLSMKLYSKLGGLLKIKTEMFPFRQAIRAVDGTSHSQKDSVEANIGRSLAKVLKEHAVLVVSCFKLAPRPGIFTVLDLHKMDVPLIGWELT